jgi:ribosome-associated translation inhibitor RaiA
MRPLTARVWEEHFTTLRPYVLEEFPEVDRQKLETVDDDWSGLVEVVHEATGLSPELVQQRLKKLDVDELGLGPGTGPDEDANAAGVEVLRLGDGFAEDERDRIMTRLEKLNRRLRQFPADATDLTISVKDRGANAQKVTLECVLPKFAPIVATSDEPDMQDALMEVREDLWRQIDEAINRRKEGAR